MTYSLSHLVRVVSALSIAAGLLAVIAPGSVADFFGLEIVQEQALGWGEIGALYGGCFVALGGLGLYGARTSYADGPILLTAIGVIWLGIASGRIAVMLTRGAEASSVFGWLSFVVEIAIGVVFVLAARSAPIDERA